VLVVEDDFDSADLLCVLSERAGHACRVARNAVEARAIIEEFEHDVALIDIGLPGESGYELLQHLKAQLTDCRFVAMTAYGSPDMTTKSLEAGFEPHLTKPVSIKLLMAVLDQCAANTAGLVKGNG